MQDCSGVPEKRADEGFGTQSEVEPHQRYVTQNIDGAMCSGGSLAEPNLFEAKKRETVKLARHSTKSDTFAAKELPLSYHNGCIYM